MTVLTQYKVEDTAYALAQRSWSPATIQAIRIRTVFHIISGHMVWFVKRKKKKAQFHCSYQDGVDNGIWWSFLTMTTGGARRPLYMLSGC
jgi:hypothetical protein